MTGQEERNGLHVRVVEATVIERSDLAGAFQRGVPVSLELDAALEGVNITRGDGKVVIARLRDGPETKAVVHYLRTGHNLAGRIEAALVEPSATVLRIRLER